MFKFFKKRNKDAKLSLGELVWFGFNYTVGITFTAVFASVIFNTSKTGDMLGTHMIWIFLVEGLIAGICAWAFTRLSRVHPGTNGAAYIYVRSSFGRFWGWFVSFMQFSAMPMVVTSQIVSIIRINFTDPNSWLYANWGVWSNFGLDLIGMTIYLFASTTIFYGIKVYKKYVNSSAYIQWIATLILVICAIVLFAKNGVIGYETITKKQHLTIHSFSNAFMSCFFFFLGFETYSTIGKNVKNPQKNIGLSIIIVMIITTAFYVIITALMIGAIISNTVGFNDNPNLQVFEKLGIAFNAKWLGNAGIIIMLLCTISLKANSGMQNALYSGGILEPFAVEGYIPNKLQKMNKDNIPYRAVILNTIITFGFAFIWLVIPDFIQAINDKAHGLSTPSTVIDYGTITGEASFIMIIIYIAVIFTTLYLSWQKKLKHNKFEFLIWTFAFIFLIWQLVMWFVSLGQAFSDSIIAMASSNATTHSQGVTELVSNIIQVTYIFIIIIFALVWYRIYYVPKLKTRINDGTQKALDDHFKIRDDWSYVARTIQAEVEKYMDRNKKINGSADNTNYKFARNVWKEIISSEGELKDKTDEQKKY